MKYKVTVNIVIVKNLESKHKHRVMGISSPNSKIMQNSLRMCEQPSSKTNIYTKHKLCISEGYILPRMLQKFIP